MNQKQIKAAKKQIVEESAINVGYYESVIPEIIENIDPDTFFNLMGRTSGEWLLESAKSNNRAEFQNILVSEAIKYMSYSDFKSIAHYFFNYEQTSEEIIAIPLELTTELYTQLQNESDEVLGIDEQDSFETQETSEIEITTKFETTQNLILEDIREAQDDFKQEILRKNPIEIFDSASKILYVSDALFELEGFIEDFTLEDYQEHSYSYEKQMCALFDRYSTDTPQNGAETFILSGTEAYYKSDVNYEIGTDDKAYFIEDYIFNYFELSPYIEPYEKKVDSPKTVTNDVDIKDKHKSIGI